MRPKPCSKDKSRRGLSRGSRPEKQVVAGKASAYHKVLENPHWQAYWRERYGAAQPFVAL